MNTKTLLLPLVPDAFTGRASTPNGGAIGKVVAGLVLVSAASMVLLSMAVTTFGECDTVLVPVLGSERLLFSADNNIEPALGLDLPLLESLALPPIVVFIACAICIVALLTI